MSLLHNKSFPTHRAGWILSYSLDQVSVRGSSVAGEAGAGDATIPGLFGTGIASGGSLLADDVADPLCSIVRSLWVVAVRRQSGSCRDAVDRVALAGASAAAGLDC